MESDRSNTVQCPHPDSSPDAAELILLSSEGESAPDPSSEMGSYRMCLCFTRKFGWREAEPPPDVREAFSKFTAGGAQMSADQLRGFLVESQGEAGVTVADAGRIVDQVRHSRHPITNKLSKPVLSVEDFHYYLFSDELNPPIRSQIHHDMSAPLSHYFIYTGHNSYLTGNQLSSDCSDVPIIKALQRGVRVIELDLWPNSAKDNVNVLHGGTLTSPVELIRCLRTIKEHAFSASPYPVIITFEDHLTCDLQSKVAEMVTQTFGDMLFIPETEVQEELPSPESLKNRVLISTKPPVKHSKKSGDKVNVPQGEPGLPGNKELDKEVLGHVPDSADKNENGRSDRDEENENDDDDSDDDPRFCQNAAPEYRHLIAIPAGKPKGGLQKALMVDPAKVRRLSLSELQLAKAAESHGTDIVRFTQRNILRIYPKGSRIDSSNYKPFTAWMHGAQMVAFNMQGYGKPLWLMHGFYRANGGCGFVKKPEFLMNASPEIPDPETPLPVKKRLKVKVYMGDGWHLDFSKTHFDNFSPPDFYVRLLLKMDHNGKSNMLKKSEKTTWSSLAIRTFSELCVEQVRKGNRSGLSLSHSAWEEIDKGFTEQMGYSLTRDKFKNKWDGMRKEYKEWLILKKLRSGLGWNDKTNTISADDDWWKDHIKRHPKASIFRYRGLEAEDDYDILFSNTVGNGENVVNPSATPAPDTVDREHTQSPHPSQNLSFIDLLNTNDVSQINIDDDLTPPYLIDEDVSVVEIPPSKPIENGAMKKRRTSIGQNLTETLQALVEDFRDRRKAKLEKENNILSIDDEMAAVKEMLESIPGLEGTLKFFATSRLIDAGRRAMFKALNPEDRLGWLQFEYNMFMSDRPTS